jgi:hypothetical protein
VWDAFHKTDLFAAHVILHIEQRPHHDFAEEFLEECDGLLFGHEGTDTSWKQARHVKAHKPTLTPALIGGVKETFLGKLPFMEDLDALS